GVCTISGSTVSFVAAGTCTLNADQAGDANYSAAAQVPQTFTVGKGAQATLNASASPSSITYGGATSLTIMGGNGDGAVSYAVTAGGAFCSINDTTLSGTGVGTCTVTATKEADANYNAATATVDVTVGSAAQSALVAVATPASIAYNATTALSTSGGNGTGAVSYAVTSGGTFCSISGTTLTGTGVGTCTVTATKAADANYNVATGTVNVTVGSAAQSTLVAVATPASIGYNGTTALTTTGGNGTGAVSYAVTTGGSFCSISGTTLTGTGVGTCTVTATKAADANYNVATATVNITVGLGAQSTLVAVATPSSIAYNGTTALSTTGGSGTGAVSWVVTSGGSFCSLSGATLTGIGVGTCTITATKAADANYGVTTATVNVSVGRATQAALTAVATPASILVSRTSTLSVTGGSGTGAVTWSFTSVQSACSLAGNSVTGLAAGSCTIRATKAADATYGAATADVTVSVSKPNPAGDAKVRAIVTQHAMTARAISTLTTQTVSTRLEALHEDVPAFVNGISVIMPRGATAYSPVDPVSTIDGAGRPLASNALDKAAGRGEPRGSLKAIAGPDFAVWTSGAITTGLEKIEGAPNKTRTNAQSVAVGIDAKVFDSFKAGISFGAYTDSSKVDEQGSKNKANALSATGYGSLNLGDGVFVDGLLGYSSIRFKSARFDANATGLLTGSRDGSMLFGSLSTSWEQRSGAVKFAPYGRFDFSHAWLGQYTEQGDQVWALAFAKTNVSSESVAVGIRGQYDIPNGAGTVSPTMRLEYRYDFGGDLTQVVSYAADPTTNYNLGVGAARHGALTGSVGLKAKGDGNLSGQIEYTAGVSASGGGFIGQGLRG
ncbi:MAG: hypothetical protein JWN07_255, partial [Hyphomicrobiales bacterium]|nr:hypothetical protein [Hyphomicrobiales bacterium]